MATHDDPTTRYQGDQHQGPDHSAPYPVSRMSPAIELVDLAKQIAHADDMLSAKVHGQLKVIADQVRSLQEQARRILAQAQRDTRLHHAQCRFRKIPGKVYHLYEKGDGTAFFSMLSPQEWGGRPPHRFVGSYRLEADMSWTPAEEAGRPDDSGELVRRLMESR